MSINKINMAKVVAATLCNKEEFNTDNGVMCREVVKLMKMKKEHLQDQYDMAMKIRSMNDWNPNK